MWTFALETLSYSSVRKGQNRKGSISAESCLELVWMKIPS